MFWFKHFSNAHDQADLNWILSEFGLEGYARYWIILELIATNLVSADEPPEVSYSWSVWCSFLKCKRKVLETFLERLENKSIIGVKPNGNVLIIKCPQLLQIKAKDFGRARPKRDHAAHKKRIEENRRDNIPPISPTGGTPQHNKIKEQYSSDPVQTNEDFEKLWKRFIGEDENAGAMVRFRQEDVEDPQSIYDTCVGLINQSFSWVQITEAWERYFHVQEYNKNPLTGDWYIKRFRSMMKPAFINNLLHFTIPQLEGQRQEFKDKYEKSKHKSG